MPKLTRARFDWRYLLLLPLPLLWALLGHYGFLDRLENHLLDFRFRARGEIEAPVNLIYVNVDARAVIATILFGSAFYALAAFAWPAWHANNPSAPAPWHFLHSMFVTVWVCLGFALLVNRVVFGKRAMFELSSKEKRQRIFAILGWGVD